MQIQADPDLNSEGKKLVKYGRGAAERPWTAVEKHKLKGLASRQLSAAKIARGLRRPIASIMTMATSLGLPIDEG